jgi:hypothetical protein
MTAALRFLIGVVVLSGLFAVDVHAQTSPTKVALLAADSVAATQDVSTHLTAAGFEVAIIDVMADTPTLADLAQYQAVFTWSLAPEHAYADPVALGNVLADFVDSGRGVVHAGFSLMSMVPFGLEGRWTVQQYGAFSQGSFNLAGSLMLQATLPTHPILAGVTDFDGGNAIAFMNVAPQGCAELVARWTNDRPLVAAGAGPNGGRVVGLNFYPVSDDFDAQYWRTSSDGAVLLANATGYAASATSVHAGAPAVALLAADDPERAADVRCKLHNLETFSQIDVIDARSTTPSLDTLLDYDAVLTWTGSSYGDAAGIGDVLADYVDANRGVVHSPASFSPGSRLDGRWIAGNYRPVVEADPASDSHLQLLPLLAGHPMLSGVATFDGGESSHHTIALVNPIAGEPDPTVVAAWTDGQPLIVFKKKAAGGYIASLNLFPPSSDVLADSWDRSTDGARLIGNTLMFVSNHAPTANAGADLTIEATAASLPVTLTATASDVDGDPLTITWSGAMSSTTGESVSFSVEPPPSSQPSHTYTVLLTVTDGRGGEATDTVDIVVEDTVGPVLQDMPAPNVTLTATGTDGAAFAYGPVTAHDAVDGIRPVTCSHEGVFPIGETVVSCTAADTRGNASTASFSVTVNSADDADDGLTPGKVFAYGFIRRGDTHSEFAFSAIERASGVERGGLRFSVKSGHNGGHRQNRRRSDYFVSRTVDAVDFDGLSAVVFSGVGRWNGHEGYLYEVSAVDRRVWRRRHDRVHIVIKSPAGTIVAQADGRLSGGSVTFVRMRD